MSMRLLTASIAGQAVLAALALTIACSPAQAGGVRSTSCGGGWVSGSGVTIWRDGATDPHVRSIPQPLSEEEIAASRERERLWNARCRPIVRQDDYGVARYSYALRGCEFGKFE